MGRQVSALDPLVPTKLTPFRSLLRSMWGLIHHPTSSPSCVNRECIEKALGRKGVPHKIIDIIRATLMAL